MSDVPLPKVEITWEDLSEETKANIILLAQLMPKIIENFVKVNEVFGVLDSQKDKEVETK